MKRVILCVLFLLVVSNSSAEVFYEGNGHQMDCDTTLDFPGQVPIAYLQYDSNTLITMYGDSRSDFADAPPYNYTNMNALVGTDTTTWNVQNFGVAGWTTTDLLGHLLNCLKVDPDTQTHNPINPNYITATKVAFEIGGNDMFHVAPFVYVYPWSMPTAILVAKDNIERIISVFQRRNKKILLIGNYPAGGIVSVGHDFVDPLKSGLLSIGFATSVGMGGLEGYYPEISSRRQIEYLRVWDIMALYPGAPVPRPDYTALDLIHPTPAGFQAWGASIGEKYRSLGWNIPNTPPEAPAPGIDDNGSGGTVGEPPASPSPIDLLLLCFLFGFCQL
ncbi:SGNH/GDSL hydrolase family protein [Leptospira venezuelensis]|uniref:SGNH/GDSL hydrolase family protein n=1 Tax=Leptospira venezuelensis TaxID=1958811 RepID=UPI000A39D616|nr:SGNH/GDSL hydrolase family protein [Leptospira venezuelensis]